MIRKNCFTYVLMALCVTIPILAGCGEQQPEFVLPSWNESAARQEIVQFVTAVTDPGSPDFVPAEQRIAVFDNDGTLWSEQPYYFQLAFALDRIRAIAPDHPEWNNQQPFKAVLENDRKTVQESGLKGLMDIVMATHAGITIDEFNQIVKEWIF